MAATYSAVQLDDLEINRYRGKRRSTKTLEQWTNERYAEIKRQRTMRNGIRARVGQTQTDFELTRAAQRKRKRKRMEMRFRASQEALAVASKPWARGEVLPL